jgi:hypothetical protein
VHKWNFHVATQQNKEIIFGYFLFRFRLKAVSTFIFFHSSYSLNNNRMAKSIPTERFLDVNSEPQRRLSPIQGYELQPLVSLEVAVRPLESIISNIQGFVWTATGNCENPKDGLEPNESASIYLYTMECMYRQLNVALRSEDRKQLVAYFPYLKLFLTALWKLDNVNSVVWRGIKKLVSAIPMGLKCETRNSC